MSILNGKIPHSPYIIADGVDVFRLKNIYKFFNCTLSNKSKFPNPHISLLYKRTGITILLNSSICMSKGSCRHFIFLKCENIALLHCSAICFFDVRSDPDCKKNTNMFILLS